MKIASGKKYMLTVLLALTAIALVATGAMAHGNCEPRGAARQMTPPEKRQQGMHPEHIQGMHGMLFRVLPGLDLSATQKEELTEAGFDYREEMIALRAERAIKELELQRLWLSDEPSRERIAGLIDELAAIWSQARKARSEYVFQLQDALADEQWEKLRTSFRGQARARRPLPR